MLLLVGCLVVLFELLLSLFVYRLLTGLLGFVFRHKSTNAPQAPEHATREGQTVPSNGSASIGSGVLIGSSQ
jgi:hypothetical protein